ncbi:MAG: hypothetical protein PWP44_1088 [Thermacetogenium sp.]|uniref:Uncharacterized protein n=1 Tax=Thermacetogenium phaeum TaxID=85874 RepID=A0A101FGE5_9THEO|nr:MAG: Uncharacterized protein XD66_0771 [Thermacetogenium phaeum]MDN5365885.1 hypothetical protein [Thermacetogenium sp.]
MEEQGRLPRSFWIELLELYDDFMKTGKTDRHTLEMLEKAGLLTEGTMIGKELLEAFPHLEFKDVEQLVRRGIREKIVENVRRSRD